MCSCMCVHTAYWWRSEGNLIVCFLLLPLHGSSEKTQVQWLVQQVLYAEPSYLPLNKMFIALLNIYSMTTVTNILISFRFPPVSISEGGTVGVFSITVV